MDHPRRQTPHGETAYSPVSLLRALTANPLDVDALRGTDGAHEEASPPDTPVTRTLTVILAVVLGFVVAVSVVDLRSDATAADSPRALLQEEVRESRGDAEQLEGENDRLEAEVAQQQGAVLEGADPESAERLAGHETAVAAGALRGPGVVLTLEDSAPLPAAPGVTEGAVNRVTDADLQLAVNGLWAAGAEAIAVNGQRLTSTSAIRTAGPAVLVGVRACTPLPAGRSCPAERSPGLLGVRGVVVAVVAAAARRPAPAVAGGAVGRAVLVDLRLPVHGLGAAAAGAAAVIGQRLTAPSATRTAEPA